MAANEGSVYTNFSNVSIGTTSGGGGFKIAGVAVTSSAAELNIMDGVTATASELNYLDIATLGTGVASKAVVLDSGDDYTWPATGILTYGVLKDSAGTTLNATVAELNAAADVSARAEVVTTTNVITAAETGKTFYLNLAGGFTSTLPAPAIGLEYTFIVQTAPTTAYIVTTDSGANVIEGMADVNSTMVLAANEDKINFAANTAIIGDWVRVKSNGTSWFVTGQSGATGGITFTVT